KKEDKEVKLKGAVTFDCASEAIARELDDNIRRNLGGQVDALNLFLSLKRVKIVLKDQAGRTLSGNSGSAPGGVAPGGSVPPAGGGFGGGIGGGIGGPATLPINPGQGGGDALTTTLTYSMRQQTFVLGVDSLLPRDLVDDTMKSLEQSVFQSKSEAQMA